jgi:hypothetical protein
MKKLNKKAITLITLMLLNVFTIQGQQFKWVKGGGTNEAIGPSTGAGGLDVEGAYYMCTDPNGNVYSLNVVGNTGIYADTFYQGSAYGAPNNLLITSYNCSGQMRWAKLIGSNSAQCNPFGIAADNLGNIYVAGLLANATLYIGNDTTIPSDYDLTTGLIQFDTTGHFKWIRYVGTNTLSTLAAAQDYSSPLAIDGLNNVHYLVYMKSGLVFMPGDTSHCGVYDMTYNTAGVLLSNVRLDLDSQWFLHGAVIDPITNKLYVCGEVDQSLSFGIVDTFFAAAFDASRSQLWWHYPGHGTNDDGFTGITLDQSKHLHFSGAAQGGFFSFNGDSVNAGSTLGYTGDMGIILTTDTNGHPLWIKQINGTLSVNSLTGITQLPNGKVAATGVYAGSLKCGSDSIIGSLGQDPYLVIVDSAGDLVTLQHILGDGFYDEGTAITSDRIGNIYIGGEVVDSIWAGTPPIPAYHSVGGNTDFFVMKYGVDCSCTSMPVAAPYTDTGTHLIGFTYTGSTTGIDSIVWNFDDGSMDTGTTALHTYSVAGTYRPCVTIYTDCGSDMYCNNVLVLIPSLIAYNQSALSEVKVWPNPVKDELNISGVVENSNYRLLSITGITIQQGILGPDNNILSVKNFASGIYILEMTGTDGVRNLVRFVKE